MNKHYDKLIRTLRHLFEMDRADLDFGFYRIMHAKAEQVQEFIESDLLHTVQDAFGEQSSMNSQELLKKARQQVIQTLGEDAIDADGNLNPTFSTIPAGKQYQEEVAKIRQQKADGSAETDIYDHLCRFFERYYEGGDFVSRRYYVRETSGKAAPYAIPYNGEEVKLHWANADQYYIKTSENYNNFTFDLRQAREIQAARQSTPLLAVQGETDKIKTPIRVHFKIKEASEGEHGNVKASDANKRFFILHPDQPVAKNEDGELVVNFEYKPLPGGKYAIEPEVEKELKDLYGSLNKGDMPVFDMARQIITALEEMDDMAEYRRLLQVLSPTEKVRKRPLLVRYLNKYTAANSMDYFIHKDLGGFLRRELDFYIKNEVMRLDDIENADVPAVESYLTKIKVLRKIAGKLIDFLAQLEDFQKKLWLKKKFVVECNYCVTLDRVPKELHGEIVGCDAQWLEWVGLGFCTTKDTKSTKKREVVLGAEPYLVVDTKFFGDGFKERLLASFDNLDEQCDGLLIYSENFQALNLLQERYREQVKCVYIDPPYNTSDNAFLYKNTYKHSSWLSMMSNGIPLASALMPQSGVLLGAIDDTEYSNFKSLLGNVFGNGNYVGTIAVEVNPAGQNIRPNVPARSHDYFHIFANNIDSIEMHLRGLTPDEIKQYKEKDETGRFYWDNLRRRGGNSRPIDRPKQWFPLYVKNAQVRVPKMAWNDQEKKWITKDKLIDGEIEAWPIDPKGEKRIWRVNPDGAIREINKGEIAAIKKAGRIEISKKSRQPDGKKPKTLWAKSKYSATTYGSKFLLNLFGSGLHFSYPKSIHLTTDAISSWTDQKATVMDYFAGSGTTAHAVINLNREDNGKRKYILIEMGQYFNTVLKPRIQKVVYSKDWQNGKPKPDTKGNLNGISHTFKYLRLESYEDTLNNLRFDDSKARDKALVASPSLKEDYTLNYMLDVETRGSQSLLNIDRFADPRCYTLKIRKPGSEEYSTQNIDLIETFNYLIGLRVTHLAVSQTFKAAFKRNPDPKLPEDQHTKLVLDGTIRITTESTEYTEKENKNIFPCPSVSSAVDKPSPVLCTAEPSGVQKNHWWFRKIEGLLPSDPANPNNGQTQKILIVWRNLSGDLEKDNTVLDAWFQKNRISSQDFEFDTIYVNGSNNLPNLQQEGDTWKVRLVEEEFMKRMWDVEGT